jgi:hypothetical protein
MINEVYKNAEKIYGVITGVILSLITAVMYVTDLKLFIAWWTALLTFQLLLYQYCYYD